MENIHYSFIYSGPLLFKTKISKSDVAKINDLCKKDSKLDFRKNTAGLIDELFEIKKLKEFQSIIDPYLNAFKQAYENWYRKTYKTIKVNQVWVNYMKSGECNPPHFHKECDFSSVIYLDFPKGLQDEIKKTVNAGLSKPGTIHFFFDNPRDYYLDGYTYLPEIGDFFIFPRTLYHSVNSFKCKGYRKSVAANLDIEEY
jgi:uncharacterized protein (TIGR02466 family)